MRSGRKSLRALVWLVPLTLGGCKDGVTNESGINPVPVVTSLSRTESMAGSPGFVLTVNGSGFVSFSRVLIAGQSRPTLSSSRSSIRVQIEDADLAVGAVLSVAVRNPTPGGGVSNAIEFRVLNPVPSVTSVNPSDGFAGTTGLTVTVTGSGFVASSDVLLGAQVRSPVHFSPTALEVELLEVDLATAGTIPVAVVSPEPGGGKSNVVGIRLANPRPQLLGLSSSGASAGGAGFTLTVYGQGFVGASVVNWNGQPRFTERVNASRLRVSIGGPDVAAAGVASITVENPAPGGGSSEATPFAVRVPGSTALTSVVRMPVVARDLISDTSRGVLYVSVPSTDPLNGNRVLRIDPATARVTGSAFVGSEPGKLAMSRDAARLYVGLDGASAVRRIQLASFEPDLQWSLQPGESAADIEVIPGNPGTVAVARWKATYVTGVSIYDDGIARPMSIPGQSGPNRIVALDDPDVLYGFHSLSSAYEFFTIAITPSGLAHPLVTRDLVHGPYVDMVGAAGRIYGSDGSIVDPVVLERVGTVRSGNAVLPDPVTGRVFVLGYPDIDVFDANTYVQLGRIAISGFEFDHPFGRIKTFVRWGEDGLAFLDRDELFLVRSPIVGR